MAGNLVVMTAIYEHPESTESVVPTYAERMESFPEVSEALEKYRIEQQQKAFARFFQMVKALNMGRTHHVRTNSKNEPERHRPDGSPFTKPSRYSRVVVSRRRSKTARLARAANR